MVEETSATGAVVLAVIGGGFTLLGVGLLLFLPRDLPSRRGVGGAVLGLGLLVLLILTLELSGGV